MAVEGQETKLDVVGESGFYLHPQSAPLFGIASPGVC
jgi:hypothetical protein